MTDLNPTPLFESFDVDLTGFESGRLGFTAHILFTTRTAGLETKEVDELLDRLNPIADALCDVEDDDWRLDELDRDEGLEVAWWRYNVHAKTPGAIVELRRLLELYTPLRAERTARYRATANLPASTGAPGCSIEDGGQAMIVELDDPVEDGDPHMFVRLQSWHDGAGKADADSHPTLRSLLGRRVRITVEDLGPAGDIA